MLFFNVLDDQEYSVMETLKEFLARGDELISTCESKLQIPGVKKLSRRIKAEVQFMKTVSIKYYITIPESSFISFYTVISHV